MLLYVRSALLELDASAALKRLLKFPPVEDVHSLVERALLLRRQLQTSPPPLKATMRPSPPAAPPTEQQQRQPPPPPPPQQQQQQPRAPPPFTPFNGMYNSPGSAPPTAGAEGAGTRAVKTGGVAATAETPGDDRGGGGVAASVPCAQLASRMDDALSELMAQLRPSYASLGAEEASALRRPIAELYAVRVILAEAAEARDDALLTLAGGRLRARANNK